MAATDLVETQQTRQYGREEYYVVRERAAREEAECQLEVALEKQFKVIIVEPARLGDQTLRWIRFGNFLHKASVLAGLGALICLPVLLRSVRYFVVVPLCGIGLSCAALYDVSWQFDPCCRYQVDHHGRELTHIPSHELHCQSPVVLVLRNDKYRRRLHNTLAVAAVAAVSWSLYRHLQS